MPASRFTTKASRWALLGGVAGVSVLAAIAMYMLGALQSLQNAAIDESFAIAGTHAAPPDIVIVAVDDSTLRQVDAQLPISRSYYARVLDTLHADRPGLIGLDLQFIGASADRNGDRALLAAFSRDGPVLVTVSDTGTGVPPIDGVHDPRGVIAASGAVDTDSDGVLRKLLYTQVRIKTFAIQAAEIISRRPIPAAETPGNHAWIDYSGPPDTYRTYSMADVLTGRVPPAAFAGKVVLVGVTAPIAKDVFVTSASTMPMSGVEVQANSIETALRGFPLQSSNLPASIVLIAALALAPIGLSLRLNALLVGLCAIVLAVLFLVAAEFAFSGGLILPFPYPVVALAISAGGVIGVEGLTERRKRQDLERTLQPLPQPANWAFFLSYRREQSSFPARLLWTALTARFGDKSVFLDERAIYAGQEFPRQIREAIWGCRVMLVIIGPNWIDACDKSGARLLDNPNDWVRREVEDGLARPGGAVIPVLEDRARMPRKSDLPESLQPLADRNAFVLTGKDFDQEVDALADAIRHSNLGSPVPRVTPEPPGLNH